MRPRQTMAAGRRALIGLIHPGESLGGRPLFHGTFHPHRGVFHETAPGQDDAEGMSVSLFFTSH